MLERLQRPSTWGAPDPDVARARATVAGVLGLQIIANGIGILAVTTYLRVLFPLSKVNHDDINLYILLAFVAALVVFGIPVNTLALRRAVRWIGEGRPPTATERRVVLHLPVTETLGSFVSWVVAGIVFGVLNGGQSRVALAIITGGMVTCMLLYMLLEAHFRPVYSLALVNASLPSSRRDVMVRLFITWLLGSGVPFIGLVASTGLGELDNISRVRWLGVGGAATSCTLMIILGSSLSRSLRVLREALLQVEHGDFETRVPVEELGELGMLAEGINDLVAGLREREELREEFGKQVGQADLADLEAGPGSSSRRDISVLFVDLEGYTRFSEANTPEAVVSMLNSFFHVVVNVVTREGGWVNKFEGDAALCIFGAPEEQADHAARALRAAAVLPLELAETDLPLSAGIGVATGEALAGFIGTKERYEYTVIGDAVNLAARLCELAKDQPNQVLADHSAITAAGRPTGWTEVGNLTIRGRNEDALAWTLRSERPAPQSQPPDPSGLPA